MKLQLQINRRELAILCSAVVICVCAMVGWRYLTVTVPPDETPVTDRHGWAGPEVAATAAPIVAAMPPFSIVDENGIPVRQDNTRANVRLWQAVLDVNHGEHLPNIPQQVGDCVSWAAKHATEYLICVELKTGPPGVFIYHDVFAPYLYGCSRVQIGKRRLKSDGSVGAWAAKAVTEYGILRSDFEGVPAYSGSVARQWGKEGPPPTFIEEARHFPIQTTSSVRTAAEIRDAVCNGYPCTIASDVGFDRIVRRDDRLVGERRGTWSHAMAVVGYDGLTGTQPYWYILNSWGPNVHGKPPDGAPPGGFWIGQRDMDAIATQGDSFAYSGFKGFRAHVFDFDLLGRETTMMNETKKRLLAF